MTVNLEEVSLIIIKLLILVSGPESILGFSVLDRSHENFRRIGKAHRSVYCFLCFIQMFHIPLLIYIQLIKNDDSQSFRVCCFVDNIIDSVSELWISVRCDANKDGPVCWERNWYIVSYYDLVEEDSDCKVVVTKSGANLMLYNLTLENNGTTYLWSNICVEGAITIEQTK